MKKYILLLFIIIFTCFTGCNADENESSANGNKTIDSNKETSSIRIESGIYMENWDNLEFTIDEVCVPDDQTALAIAKSIFSNFQEQGKYPNYVPLEVFFDTENQLWIVSFSEPLEIEKDTYRLGSSFLIAIRKDNAQVFKMWVEEG